MKKNLIFALGLSLITGFTACSSEIEDGTTDIDSWEMPYEEVVSDLLVFSIPFRFESVVPGKVTVSAKSMFHSFSCSPLP